MTFNPGDSISPFLQTSIYLPSNADQALLKLQAFLTDVSLKVNRREIAFYQTVETLTGQSWPSNPGELIDRQTFRKIFQFGAIAIGANLVFSHNIPDFSFFTKIYGTVVTDVIDYRPIPYVDATVATSQIELLADDSFIYIGNGTTSNNITSGVVILEYLKD